MNKRQLDREEQLWLRLENSLTECYAASQFDAERKLSDFYWSTEREYVRISENAFKRWKGNS